MKQAPFIMAVLAAGGPALAELPPQECHDEAIGGYDVIWHHGGFVMYNGRYSHTNYALVMEDCTGDRVLSINLPYEGADLVEKWDRDEALHGAIEKAIRSKQKYTLGQIAAIAREQGARATVAASTYESCACEKYGTVNP